MNLNEALLLAKADIKVRPKCWARTNPDHWVAAMPYTSRFGPRILFVECGSMEEMPHALHLQYEDELLGEWEETP